MRNRMNLPRHELIGLKVEILKSSDPSLEGVTGRITDEKKNIMIIEKDKNTKRIIKSRCVFRITLPDGDYVDIEGRNLVGTPEERLKRKGK